MAAAYVSSVAAGVASAVGTVSANEPAGTTGDLLVAFCWCNNTTSTWTAPATGPAWSNGDQDSAAGSAIFYVTSADAGGTSRTFTRSSSTGAAGVVIVRISGWSAFAASDIVNSGASATTTLPSITAAASNSLLLQVATKATTTAGTWTAPGGVTTRVATNSTTSGTALPYCIGDEIVASGATGTRGWSNTNSQQGRGAIIAISSTAATGNAGFLALI